MCRGYAESIQPAAALFFREVGPFLIVLEEPLLYLIGPVGQRDFIDVRVGEALVFRLQTVDL
jgi:hypothetical protein